MRKTSDKEREAVLRLDGPARFAHFVKRVVDAEEAWGLWDDGWALMADDEGTQSLPLWPAPEYAELHRTGEWSSYSPKSVALAELQDDLLPRLEQAHIGVAVFPTPNGKGVTPSMSELTSALAEELEKYE